MVQSLTSSSSDEMGRRLPDKILNVIDMRKLPMMNSYQGPGLQPLFPGTWKMMSSMKPQKADTERKVLCCARMIIKAELAVPMLKSVFAHTPEATNSTFFNLYVFLCF